MKALTVRQPWAWFIVQGDKTVENRTRRTNYRGRIAIHAGKQPDQEALRTLPGRDPQGRLRVFEYGQVLGTVEVIGCHHADDCAREHFTNDHLDSAEVTFCSPWAQEDAWHWELADARTVEPFPAVGKLGLWELATDGTTLGGEA